MPHYLPPWPPSDGSLTTLSDIINVGKKAGIPIHVGLSANNYVYTGQVKPGYLYISSTKRANLTDYHGYWMAVDFSSIYDTAGRQLMEKFATYMLTHYSWELELIHKGITKGAYVKNGTKVSASFYGSTVVSQHANHVHVAMSPRAAKELRTKLYPTTAVYHTVVSGDTLSSIATKYNTTVDAIMKLNPTITDPNKIVVGQRVRVK